MYSAEVVPNHKQSDSSFQIEKLLADSVRLSRKAPDMHSYGQVGTFNMRSRYARKIRVSRSHLRNGCNDSAATVPLWACLSAPVNLLKLGKGNVRTIPLFDCADMTAQGITVIW
jgi:hypothetical protein